MCGEAHSISLDAYVKPLTHLKQNIKEEFDLRWICQRTAHVQALYLISVVSSDVHFKSTQIISTGHIFYGILPRFLTDKNTKTLQEGVQIGRYDLTQCSYILVCRHSQSYTPERD